MVWNRKTWHASSTNSSTAGPASEVATAITGSVGPRKCKHFPSDKNALSGNTEYRDKNRRREPLRNEKIVRDHRQDGNVEVGGIGNLAR